MLSRGILLAAIAITVSSNSNAERCSLAAHNGGFCVNPYYYLKNKFSSNRISNRRVIEGLSKEQIIELSRSDKFYDSLEGLKDKPELRANIREIVRAMLPTLCGPDTKSAECSYFNEELVDHGITAKEVFSDVPYKTPDQVIIYLNDVQFVGCGSTIDSTLLNRWKVNGMKACETERWRGFEEFIFEASALLPVSSIPSSGVPLPNVGYVTEQVISHTLNVPSLIEFVKPKAEPVSCAQYYAFVYTACPSYKDY